MTGRIFVADTDDEIQSCFEAFSVLRPHVKKDDFLSRVRRQQAQSFQIVAIEHEGVVKSAAGFRLAECLAWGRVLYIDDLTTLSSGRSQGLAGELLDWLIDYAREHRCDAVHLDTGYTRHPAHRLYLKKGFQLNAHHMALELGHS